MYLRVLIHEHRAMSHDEQVSWEDISQHETTSKHIVVNGHCEPGAQTQVWLSPTWCWIYLGHRHECDCHQHAVGFTWGTGTIVTVTNMLCIVKEGTLLPMLSKIHTAKKLSSFQQSSPLSYWLKGECCVEQGSSSSVPQPWMACPCQVLENNDATFA